MLFICTVVRRLSPSMLKYVKPALCDSEPWNFNLAATHATQSFILGGHARAGLSGQLLTEFNSHEASANHSNTRQVAFVQGHYCRQYHSNALITLMEAIVCRRRCPRIVFCRSHLCCESPLSIFTESFPRPRFSLHKVSRV
jgi:hypothetical protein